MAIGFLLGVAFSAGALFLYQRAFNPHEQFVAVKPFALVDRRSGTQLVIPAGAEVYRVNNITGYAVDDFHHDGLLRFSWDPGVTALVPGSVSQHAPEELPVLRSAEREVTRGGPPSNSPLQPTSTAPPVLQAR